MVIVQNWIDIVLASTKIQGKNIGINSCREADELTNVYDTNKLYKRIK